MASSEGDAADTVRFLVASDTHLGYMERDPVRGRDSLDTFEEILQLARAHRVDFVLLGGDVFHENKPSRPTLFRTMSLLRQYTLGDEPMALELLSDPFDDVRKGQTFPMVNCEDMDLNVCMPVFSIHGNHDDPQGMGEDGTLSALDVLAAAGLLNYFGRLSLSPSSRKRRAPESANDVIGVKPVLLQKGQTRIALYGMGYIKDERMSHELREKHICMYRPAEATDSWFNLLVLHQNRSAHSPKAHVPESALDDSLHLVIWGHEHEQRIVPEAVAEKSYKISQPGSTIATSLSPGETTSKCVAVVQVTGQTYHVEPIPLQTVRPYLYKSISLPVEAASAQVDPTDRVAVAQLLRHHIEAMLVESEREWLASARSATAERPLPLVRLRVSYDTQIPLGNLARFGQSFMGRVANPKDLLQLHLLRGRRSAPGTRASVVPLDSRMAPAEKLERMDLASLVMENVRLQQFDLLHPQGLQSSMLEFVVKDERDSIASFLDKSIARVEQQLSSQHMQEAQLQSALERISAQQDSVLPPAAPADPPSSPDSMEQEISVSSVRAPRAPSHPVPTDLRDSTWSEGAMERVELPAAEPAHSTPDGVAERGAGRRTRRRLPERF
ncbi:meiotic recombination [Malassezia caprae]|uniref:Double-strand break repair protein n=1 Tax=Malassezia caprae TaxID=1381934 RepID=A0AAF0IUS1_9BASI|nr:meiotic recombination [Malassezia caprae]